MSMHAMPSPPLRAPGKLAFLETHVRAALVRGRSGACCVCIRSCGSWFSATAPSGYVPLHADCAHRLVEHWISQLYTVDGELIEQTPTMTSAPLGAYARRSAIAAPVARRVGHQLPQGFTPGRFWLPGDDEHAPWTVLLETAAGHTIVPCGSNRARAERLTAEFAAWGTLGPFSSVPVVGGVAVGPQDELMAGWGQVPRLGLPRWEPARQADTWTTCGRCGRECWPGVWMSGSVCRACADDKLPIPRPVLDDPPRPAMGPPVKVKKKSEKSAMS